MRKLKLDFNVINQARNFKDLNTRTILFAINSLYWKMPIVFKFKVVKLVCRLFLNT